MDTVDTCPHDFLFLLLALFLGFAELVCFKVPSRSTCSTTTGHKQPEL